LGVGIELQGNLASIAGVLLRLEYARPLLFVEAATLRANDYGSRRQDTEPVLDVQLELHGFQPPQGAELRAAQEGP
jgi:hypothetical protein